MTENAAVVFEPADAWGLEALLISRVRLYTLFHKLFGGNTTPELVAELLCQDTRDALEEFAGHGPEMRNLLRFLEELAGRDRAELVDEAKDEYTRQFVGPGRLPAMPIESPYLTHDAATVQENTLVIRMEYRMFDLQAKRYQRVPEDHVAMMCGFVATCAEGSLQALRAGDLGELEQELRSQQAFVSRHMVDWLPEFAEITRRNTKTTVMFPQLIEALSVFVKLDETLLSESAYWAGAVQLPENGVPEPPEEVGAAFAQAESAIERLKAIRLVGLEDVELVKIPN